MWSDEEIQVIKRLDKVVKELALSHSQLSVAELIGAETTWRRVKEVWEEMDATEIKHYGIYLSFYRAIADSLVELIEHETDNQFKEIINHG